MSNDLGIDRSGNNNNWTVTNLTATDQTTDTPTNNFCTLNPLDKIASASIAFYEGNLKAAVDDNGNTRGNFFVNSGKWYWETLIVSGDSVSTVGIAEPGYYSGNLFDGSSTAKGYIYINDGNKRSPAGSASAYGDSYADDDIIGVALNMDDDEVIFYNNINDLSEKLNYFKKNNLLRKKYAKNGQEKYFMYFDSRIVSDYIISKSFDIDIKKPLDWM